VDDDVDLVNQLRARAMVTEGDTSALLIEAADIIEHQGDLATAGAILQRFASTDGEWWEVTDTTLQVDGTVDITPAEAELLRRLTA
jgi:hypothetical protein